MFFYTERFARRTARRTTTGALLTSPACFADAHQYSRCDQYREPGNPDDRRANRRTHSVSGFVGAILGTRANDRVVGAHLIHARGAGRATAGRSVGKTPRSRRAALVANGVLASAARNPPAAEPSPLGFPLPTSDRSVSHPYSARLAQLLDRRVRTRMHGGVARSRKASPYP